MKWLKKFNEDRKIKKGLSEDLKFLIEVEKELKQSHFYEKNKNNDLNLIEQSQVFKNYDVALNDYYTSKGQKSEKLKAEVKNLLINRGVNCFLFVGLCYKYKLSKLEYDKVIDLTKDITVPSDMELILLYLSL
jgi:hypothetical protein